MEKGGMHIVFAAHRTRIPEALGYRVDRRDDVAVRLALARRRPLAAQLDGREHRAAPGAEVLGARVAPGDAAQVLVHVIGRDQVALASAVDVLEELLPG